MDYTEGATIFVFVVGLWLWARARAVVRPSQGSKIEPRPGTAVLLVNLQEVFWNDRHYDAQTRARVEGAVAREVALAQQGDQPVIALRQEFSGLGFRLVARLLYRGEAIQGGPGTGLAEPFVGIADHVLVKSVQDGFESGELDVVLRVLRVGHLRILGLDGEHDVAKTAQGALNRGFEVTLVGDGIATARAKAFEPVAEALGGQGARIA
ncbi:cysteine hydrolase family protein [Roseovarius aestuariivivens]|uniref:cysteine hydrolase family protein n=1 Tax=Roseovarius aestuariivivens TaxID=1888910 RepID=UPI001436BD6D|nr:isochorismatase family protein [Roseovarius aestuariivivens]